MALIYRSVRQKLARLQEYGMGANSQSLRYSRKVGIRGLMYSGAFCLSFASTVVSQISEKDENSPNRIFYLIVTGSTMALNPLQGFWNALIFFQGRWNKLSQQGRSLYFLTHLTPTSSAGFFASRDSRDSTPDTPVSSVPESHAGGDPVTRTSVYAPMQGQSCL